MASNTAGDLAYDVLETPTLDSESPNLLLQISEQGGYAYVSMSVLAAAGDLRAAEATREMAWEQLHSGPWHSVLPVWRDAYSMACLYVAKLHHRAGDFGEALKVLDMGLIMGGTLLRQDLHAAVEKVTAKASELRVSEEEQGEVIVGGENAYHEAEVSLKCLQVGKNYLSSDWKQELITFSQFLERIQSSDCTSTLPTYLAQHPLFDQIHELRKDIFIPDYCYAGGGELRSLNAWFGPAGTVTPLHHDPHHNILAQVVGKKYIRLYPASLSEELYPYTETMLCNSSKFSLKVDLDNIDEKEFPKVKDLEFQDCILEEGEMLYIPPKWWHYVRSLTTSFSVSFWWSNCGGSPAS
ncbi:lysine-specific demethylase JMJ30 isoform X3 [Vitis vinifera]|uniref:lysine-specific demethylase JMJ30 isoform X3 n=1 Tax=Vitis vinifera TaxID=29760 RepID=UPI00053FBA77|nr:lysine-specific demethylase JMJ30 isoform X3 [Vitis vinifera]|eukprot:XP_010651267.1 PREDICTED: lysine-specific demethylase JMJ30 isoform X3 [Vitis vinifera]